MIGSSKDVDTWKSIAAALTYKLNKYEQVTITEKEYCDMAMLGAVFTYEVQGHDLKLKVTMVHNGSDVLQ